MTHAPTDPPTLAAIAGAVVIGGLTLSTPAVTGALLFVMLGFDRRRSGLVGLAAVFLDRISRYLLLQPDALAPPEVGGAGREWGCMPGSRGVLPGAVARGTFVIRRVLILIGLLASAGLVAWEVSKKERLLASGDTVLLELAPVDPRSLMQGDYMRLDYAIARQWRQDASWPRDGAVVVVLDESGVAQFQRRDQGESLAAGERRLTYRIRNGRLQRRCRRLLLPGGAGRHLPAGTIWRDARGG